MQGYWSLGPFGVSPDSETLCAPGALPSGPRCASLPVPVSGQINTGLEREGLTWSRGVLTLCSSGLPLLFQSHFPRLRSQFLF